MYTTLDRYKYEYMSNSFKSDSLDDECDNHFYI